jgi:hypothetical protein
MLIWLLRGTGGVMLCALVFVFCPFEWMQAIHRRLGMGEIEHTPLLSYLIRTLSAMYASFGAVLAFISCDADRYRPLVDFLGIVAVLGGVGVTILDAVIELPLWWTATEGPFTVLLGLLLLTLRRR